MHSDAALRKTTAAIRRGNALPAAAPLTAAQATKTLMVLGLLKSGPRHGYELHRIVVAHGTLYADFKKPTLYHLLHRLALQGAVEVKSEGGARGPRGERLVFALAPKGEALFQWLLQRALSSYDAMQIHFEVAAGFLAWIPARAAQSLLKKRREVIRVRRAEIVVELDSLEEQPHSQRVAARHLAADHALSLMDAEMAWMDRAIRQVMTPGTRKARTTTGAAALRRAVGA